MIFKIQCLPRPLKSLPLFNFVDPLHKQNVTHYITYGLNHQVYLFFKFKIPITYANVKHIITYVMSILFLLNIFYEGNVPRFFSFII